jgi:hypothetical protein
MSHYPLARHDYLSYARGLCRQAQYLIPSFLRGATYGGFKHITDRYASSFSAKYSVLFMADDAGML